MVVIVDHDQVAELEVTSGAGCLACNTLHSTTISEEAVGVVVDQVIAGLVEYSTSMSLSNCETNSIGEALAQRACRDFDTFSIMCFRVSRRDAVNLLQRSILARSRILIWLYSYPEVLQVIEGDFIPKQVQKSVL